MLAPFLSLGTASASAAPDQVSPPEVAPRQVAARAGCYQLTCGGLRPEAAGCDKDPFLATLLVKDGLYPGDKIQLRYSRLCDAYWARYVGKGITGSCYQLSVQIQVGFRNADGSFAGDGRRQRNGDRCGDTWTAMMSATDGRPRWARVRAGSLMSWPGGSETTWRAWSGWIKS